MDTDEPTNGSQFNAAMPLPAEPSPSTADNPAAELIRQKVRQAYAWEPNAGEEALSVVGLGATSPRSKHQQFVYDITMSGRPIDEIQTAWHEYYAGLTDVEKHQVWQEFYDMHARASKYSMATPAMAPGPPQADTSSRSRPKAAKKKLTAEPSNLTIADLKNTLIGNLTGLKKFKPFRHLQSVLFGLGVGSVVILIFLFGFFNERFIAPFIQPSRTITNTPIINGNTAISGAPEVIIPKINVEIPVVYGVDTISETAVDKALENGVVHYADTALPGHDGNVVIVGHSSNNIFNQGRYKFAFVLLSRLENGDTFYLQKDGIRYTYQVYIKQIVKPTDVSVLAPRDKPAVATLITCDPPGTSTNRLVVVGAQISPSPVANAPQTTQNSLATKTAIIPGNSPSLWSRLVGWFSH